MPVEERQQDFQAIEREYDHLYRETPIRDEDRAYRFHIKNILRIQPNALSFLDVACGAGYFLREAVWRTQGKGNYTGTDISSVALDLAKKQYPRATYVKAIAEELPLPDSQFDAVSCLGSMEHFMDIAKAIRQMIRVAKPEALFYIMVPNIFWYKDLLAVLFKGSRLTRNQTHEHFASLEEWRELLEENGLHVTKTQKYNGIAKNPFKQMIKDAIIPLRFSYHFIFICRKSHG